MRFLLDQDVYAATGRFLISLGHDVITAGKIGLSRASDSDLLKVLQEHSESDLKDAFVVVETGRHRFRKIR